MKSSFICRIEDTVGLPHPLPQRLSLTQAPGVQGFFSFLLPLIQEGQLSATGELIAWHQTKILPFLWKGT